MTSDAVSALHSTASDSCLPLSVLLNPSALGKGSFLWVCAMTQTQLGFLPVLGVTEHTQTLPTPIVTSCLLLTHSQLVTLILDLKKKKLNFIYFALIWLVE